ncbi:MAG: SRPBCC domain-containing protein [Fimbriimonadaceae bacterium]|nr:SRPBCC domain-containing protein [Fimbriimonadaceae bacterium]
MKNLSLEVKRIVNATPERIYRAWTDAEQLRQWHCPEGMTVKSAETPGTAGSTYEITMVSPDGSEHPVHGEFTELVPNERIVLTWNYIWGGETRPTTQITVSLLPINPSETQITLLHEYFQYEEDRDDHRDGWTSALANLDHYLADQ